MAGGVLACERALARLDHRTATTRDDATRRALDRVPHAAEWAQRFTADLTPSVKRFSRIAAPSIVSNVVKGIADACVPDPDALLRRLLVDAIGECRRWVSPPVDTTARHEAQPHHQVVASG
ncbi:MAG TPA: hypothetical protein VK891_01880 [Euzebyales bacterium]|nr:hypothetical protein [Euzebyales bacterium]